MSPECEGIYEESYSQRRFIWALKEIFESAGIQYLPLVYKYQEDERVRILEAECTPLGSSNLGNISVGLIGRNRRLRVEVKAKINVSIAYGIVDKQTKSLLNDNIRNLSPLSVALMSSCGNERPWWWLALFFIFVLGWRITKMLAYSVIGSHCCLCWGCYNLLEIYNCINQFIFLWSWKG